MSSPSQRRRFARLLFAALRGIGLLAGLGCLAMLAVVLWFPAWLDAYGDARRYDFDQSWFARWSALGQLAAADPAAARTEAAELSRELQGVRKEDRLSTMVRLVEGIRHRLSMQAGDEAEAIAAGARLVAMDDRDIDGALLFAEALQAAGRGGTAGIAVLEPMAHAVPTDRRVVSMLGRLHLEAGEERAAARVLLQAGRYRTDPGWRVRWGKDPRQSSWCVPHHVDADTVALRFTLREPADELILLCTATSALRLTAPKLSVSAGGEVVTQPLAAASPGLDNARFVGTHLILDGNAPASIVLRDLPSARGEVTVTLTAGYRATPSRWLADLLLGDLGERLCRVDDAALAAAMRRLRGEALSGCLVTVLPMSNGQPQPRIHVAWNGTADAFDATFEVPAAATTAVVRLPARARLSYDRITLSAGEADCGAAVRRQGLERINGGRVTGAEPWLEFALPEKPRAATFTLRGRLQ